MLRSKWTGMMFPCQKVYLLSYYEIKTAFSRLNRVMNHVYFKILKNEIKKYPLHFDGIYYIINSFDTFDLYHFCGDIINNATARGIETLFTLSESMCVRKRRNEGNFSVGISKIQFIDVKVISTHSSYTKLYLNDVDGVSNIYNSSGNEVKKSMLEMFAIIFFTEKEN